MAKPLTVGLMDNPATKLQPAQAQEDGTSVQRALKHPALKVFLLSRLIRLSDRLDMGKRMSTQQEYQECIDRIIAEVPALTFEEIEIVFRDMERGRIPLYNRCKMPEVLAALLDYDSNQAIEVRERRMQSPKDDTPRMSEQKPEWLSLTEADLMAINDVQQQAKGKE